MLLSGGQKARLALARAVYSDADLYILDDPLSACDSIVGRSLFEKCIRGLLTNFNWFTDREKPPAVMLITHQLQFVKSCDNVIILTGGRITGHQGPFKQVVDSIQQKSDFVLTMTKFLETDDAEEKVETKPFDPGESVDIVDDTRVSQDSAAEMVTAEGQVSLSTYFAFFAAAVSVFTSICIFVLMAAGQVFYLFSEYWLGLWAALPRDEQLEQAQRLISIYSILVVSTVVTSVVRAEVFFFVCLRGSASLFKQMLKVVVRSPLFFFENQPHGRLLNRFSKVHHVDLTRN